MITRWSSTAPAGTRPASTGPLSTRPASNAARVFVAILAAVVAAVTMLAACTSPASQHTRSGAATPSPHVPVLRGLTEPATGQRYYLALGDSLAQGVQPGPTGADVSTADGYPQRLAAMLRRSAPDLRLILMGCSGETTGTMIAGGTCRYRQGSQLAQATAFLREHGGQVALITIDIGANDPNSCVFKTGFTAISSCLSARTTTALRNLRTILHGLRSAGGVQIPIIGMTYYVPELGLWLTGRTGTELAALSERLAAAYNRLLISDYHRYGAQVADVFGAFRSSNFAARVRLRGHGVVPANVAAVCSLTWMCARPPRGPNEHANEAGYRLIARTFWLAIAR